MSESNNPQRNDTIRYDTMRRYLVMFGLATSNKRPLHLFLSRSFFFSLVTHCNFFVLAHCEREPRKIWHANAKQMQMQIKTIQIHCTHLAQGQTKSRFMSIMLEQMSKLPMSRSGLGKPLCTPTPYPVQKRRPSG